MYDESCRTMGQFVMLVCPFLQLCFGIDYDFSTHQCFFHTRLFSRPADTVPLCPTAVALPILRPLDLQPHPSSINIILCTYIYAPVIYLIFSSQCILHSLENAKRLLFSIIFRMECEQSCIFIRSPDCLGWLPMQADLFCWTVVLCTMNQKTPFYYI